MFSTTFIPPANERPSSEYIGSSPTVVDSGAKKISSDATHARTSFRVSNIHITGERDFRVLFSRSVAVCAPSYAGHIQCIVVTY